MLCAQECLYSTLTATLAILKDPNARGVRIWSSIRGCDICDRANRWTFFRETTTRFRERIVESLKWLNATFAIHADSQLMNR
jgi:hypothetical protein